MIDLTGHTVLFLGGRHEMTQGVINAFQQVGCNIFVGGDQLKGESPMVTNIPIAMDDPEAMADQFRTYPFDVAVISPGWFKQGTFLETSIAAIEAAMNKNFEQATFFAQAAAKSMIYRKQAGSIIFLSSVAGLMPMMHTNLVGSSLAAAHVIARMAAVDLAPHDIRVNVVAAGWVDKSWAGHMLTENGLMQTPDDIPLNSSGSIRSISDVCCFLASPMSDYITGAVIPVDGGFLLTKSSSKSPIKN